MLLFEYRGYLAQADLNEQQACYEGAVMNMQDLIRFQGLSPAKVKQAFQECVDIYLMLCQKYGIEPSKPKSQN